MSLPNIAKLVLESTDWLKGWDMGYSCHFAGIGFPRYCVYKNSKSSASIQKTWDIHACRNYFP